MSTIGQLWRNEIQLIKKSKIYIENTLFLLPKNVCAKKVIEHLKKHGP